MSFIFKFSNCQIFKICHPERSRIVTLSEVEGLGVQHYPSHLPFLPLYVPIFFIFEEKIKKDFHYNRAQLFPLSFHRTFKNKTHKTYASPPLLRRGDKEVRRQLTHNHTLNQNPKNLKSLLFALKSLLFALKSLLFVLKSLLFALKSLLFPLKPLPFILKSLLFTPKPLPFALKSLQF